jgi:hypothetical protein
MLSSAERLMMISSKGMLVLGVVEDIMSYMVRVLASFT